MKLFENENFDNLESSEEVLQKVLTISDLLSKNVDTYLLVVISFIEKKYNDVKITYVDKMLLKFLLIDDNKFKDIFLKIKFTDDNRDKLKFNNLDDEIAETIYQFYFNQNTNLIKRTCSVLNLSYRELGHYTGLNENTLNKLASTGEINDQFKKAIELYVETRKLKDELKDVETLKRLLKGFFQ